MHHTTHGMSQHSEAVTLSILMMNSACLTPDQNHYAIKPTDFASGSCQSCLNPFDLWAEKGRRAGAVRVLITANLVEQDSDDFQTKPVAGFKVFDYTLHAGPRLKRLRMSKDLLWKRTSE